MHVNPRAGQSQKLLTQPTKSAGRKQCKSECRNRVRQLTPKTATPSPSPSPPLPRPGTYVQQQQCKQDLSSCEAISLHTRTAENSGTSVLRRDIVDEGLCYQTTSGIPTQQSSFHEPSAQTNVEMQPEIFNPVAMQAMSLGGSPTKENMDYDFQHPRSVSSPSCFKPPHSLCRNQTQQLPAPKIERSPMLCTSWFPEASSQALPSSTDPPFFQQGRKDVPMAFALGFPAASNMQDSGLPFTSSTPSQNCSFSDDTSYDTFQGGSVNLAYRLQTADSYGSFPMDIDGQVYPRNYPCPPR